MMTAPETPGQRKLRELKERHEREQREAEISAKLLDFAADVFAKLSPAAQKELVAEFGRLRDPVVNVAPSAAAEVDQVKNEVLVADLPSATDRASGATIAAMIVARLKAIGNKPQTIDELKDAIGQTRSGVVATLYKSKKGLFRKHSGSGKAKLWSLANEPPYESPAAEGGHLLPNEEEEVM